MTLDEARGCTGLALWSGRHDEFLLAPESGVISWRSVEAVSVVHGDSWHPVPAGKTVPTDGWSHRFGCTCPGCCSGCA